MPDPAHTTKQEKFELTIKADSVISTDVRFTLDDLGLGDNYKPLDTYFIPSDGEKIWRKHNKGERRISNQTMPKLACQIFESEIAALSKEEKEQFPICQYSPNKEIIRGIYSSEEEFHKYNTKSINFLEYNYGSDKQFVFHVWNIFSTIAFIQECLKRFGKEGDQFVLTYREKTEDEKKKKESIQPENAAAGEQKQEPGGPLNPYSAILLESKNIILRGAPGTGKSYLAKEIAADIISNGYFDDYTLLTDEQKKQVEFVQFHPSYDYSDFVEGLRPRINDDGTMRFELKDGVFTRFAARAQKNYDNSRKSPEAVEKLKPYVFIIDEINRGEISKIFGELFFAIDPGYRGPAGEVSTQYANLHENPDKKFSVPENVYIIGTMNDIDRSVDSFDFAMRRRFRFIEIKADERLEMLADLGEELETEAIKRMSALNDEIVKVEELNADYQIGAAYFLKLKNLDFNQLWTDYLEPLLRDYIRGMYGENGIMKKFAKAYGYAIQKPGDADETVED